MIDLNLGFDIHIKSFCRKDGYKTNALVDVFFSIQSLSLRPEEETFKDIVRSFNIFH